MKRYGSSTALFVNKTLSITFKGMTFRKWGHFSAVSDVFAGPDGVIRRTRPT